MKQYYYQLADLKVQSDIDLSYAYSVQDNRIADIIIEEIHQEPEDVPQLLEKHNNGAAMFYRYDKQAACFSYANQGYFSVEGDNSIKYYLYPDYDKRFIIQTLLCQCFGALIARRGMIGIHSGVCCLDHRAVIVCGDSGAGKTTLIAELIKQGAKLMADDTACITVDEKGIYSHSLVPLRKMCKDTLLMYPCDNQEILKLPSEIKPKIGIKETEQFHVEQEKVGILAWIRIGDQDNVEVRRLSCMETIEAVKQNLYAKGAYQNLLLDNSFFGKLVAFCNQVPIYEIKRPKNKITVTEIADKIKELMQT